MPPQHGRDHHVGNLNWSAASGPPLSTRSAKKQVTTEPTTNGPARTRQNNFLSAVTMMRPAAARSRTFGRYAVGLAGPIWP